MRDTKKKLAVVVKAAGTTLTEIFGAGPVVAATVIGAVTDVSRFPGRDHFAAYNGTAPIEVSSGNRKIYRLPGRGNRRLNHAVHMAAVTQIRHRHSNGRAYYDRKLATKRRSGPSNGASATPSTPASRPTPAAPPQQPGQGAREGNRGTTLPPARPAHHPENQLFRPSHSRARHHPTTPERTLTKPSSTSPEENPERLLTTKRLRYARSQHSVRRSSRARRRIDLARRYLCKRGDVG